MHIPTTSKTLLRTLGENARSARWTEFVARYRPMMEAYLHDRFPFVEADDIIQETLVALVAKLPSYRYVPNETGCFHNYLTGILRRKALTQCSREKRKSEVLSDFREEPSAVETTTEQEEKKWRESIYEIALEQILADDTIQDRTKQIFLRTAVNGESPEDVAESFGIKRNAVDQAKSRVIEKLRDIVRRLEFLDAPGD